jgi:hypothetical protein
VNFGRAVVERWDGSSWSTEAAPTPAGSDLTFGGVSCPNTTTCIAVAGLQHPNAVGSEAAAEVWDGTHWTIQNTANPGSLSGVSCTSATACIAVGPLNNYGNSVLAARWDGASWTVATIATINNGYLGGVSCVSAAACIAVGSGANFETLVERWDGTSWTIQTTPNPAGATNIALSAVSCTSATACTAVGSYSNGAGDTVALIERWDGMSWTIQSTPSPPGPDSALYGVSCTSATRCTAVGAAGDGLLSGGGIPAGGEPLAEVWDGTTWTIQDPPAPGGGASASLSGVSCTAATACVAVGTIQTSPGNSASSRLFVEQYG